MLTTIRALESECTSRLEIFSKKTWEMIQKKTYIYKQHAHFLP